MNSTNVSTRTCEEARAWLEAWGVSVSQWAKVRGFPKEVVYAVLSGRSRGKRGQAYQVAVELGIKAPPAEGDRSPLEAPIFTGMCRPNQSGLDGAIAGKDLAMSP